MKHDPYIICIDDDEDDCILFKEALANYQDQIEVKFFNSAETALSYLNESLPTLIPPRLVILDINMPRMNGLQALIELKKLLPDTVRFLFFSTNPNDQNIIEQEKNGVTIMSKPSTVAGYSSFAITILDLFFSDIFLAKNDNESRKK